MKNKMTRLYYTGLTKVKKHSPELLLAAGITGVIASTVLACKETIKAQEVIEKKNDDIKKIHEAFALNEDRGENSDYTEDDRRKDLTIVYTRTTVDLLKTYAPAITLGVVSITSILAGHHILKKRNVAITAAYAVLDKGFKKYRSNVIEKFGEEVDKELRFNIKEKEGEEVEGSKEKYIDTEANKSLGLDQSEYSRFFDATCQDFQKDPEYNMMYLRNQQDYANELLKARGHLFLNEVYDLLDIPRSKAGQVVGWIYDEKHPIGDNYVDFGLYNGSEANRRFVNGLEYNILLDFNVDGVIYDKI